MAQTFKTPADQAADMIKPQFAFSDDHINDIGLALKKPSDQSIDLGNGLSISVSKPRGYRSKEEMANAVLDIIDDESNSLVDTFDIFGTEFDDDYRKELLQSINNYKR